MADREQEIREQIARCIGCAWRGPYSEVVITFDRTYACPECHADVMDDSDAPPEGGKQVWDAQDNKQFNAICERFDAKLSELGLEGMTSKEWADICYLVGLVRNRNYIITDLTAERDNANDQWAWFQKQAAEAGNEINKWWAKNKKLTAENKRLAGELDAANKHVEIVNEAHCELHTAKQAWKTIYTKSEDFDRRVNDAVAEGWIVHPESLQIDHEFDVLILLDKPTALTPTPEGAENART